MVDFNIVLCCCNFYLDLILQYFYTLNERIFCFLMSQKHPSNMIKECKKFVSDLFKIHTTFTVSFGANYIFAAFFMFTTYYFRTSNITNFYDAFELFMTSFVPATISYIFVNICANFIGLMNFKSKNCIWNIIGNMFILFYTVIYIFYLHNTKSIAFIVIEILATFLAFFLNWMCYLEFYKVSTRNHDFC